MINLFISGANDAWDSSPVLWPSDRALTEYILPDYKQRYSLLSETVIRELKSFPCIFAYESWNRKDAHVGWITNISVRQTNVMIEYQLTDEKISFEEINKLQGLLDLGTWELNRTHWTVKNISIDSLRHVFTTTPKPGPKVFISYCWSPIQNQEYVFQLVAKLRSDGISVVYDRDDLYPGQDNNYFMEQAISNNDIDNIIIVCNKDYAQKADARKGGVGYEAEIILTEIRSNPMQRRVIPVSIETDEYGKVYLPVFCKSRNFIDLTRDTGYKELLDAIWNYYKSKSEGTL